MKETINGVGSPESAQKKRKYLSQSEVPSLSLDQALRVPRAISDNYGGGPVTPVQLGVALDMSPTSGPFRTLCGASIAYGLTEGGCNAKEIKITSVGDRILKPLSEGDDNLAKREAILKPNVVAEFLNKYSGSPLPRHDIAHNVLESMNVPSNKTETVLSLIVTNAESVGLISEIKGKQYVELNSIEYDSNLKSLDGLSDEDSETIEEISDISEDYPDIQIQSTIASTSTESVQSNRKVFITHGKNKSFIDPIKKLLGFGELEPVVSVEKQSVSKPVPEKVMDDMRSCGAAIIHVTDEKIITDKDNNEHVFINPNVLIEIGAAMALFGRRYILLVKEGIDLPTNLQGLYEVRYSGETLDGNATIKLMEAINDIKNNPMPER